MIEAIFGAEVFRFILVFARVGSVMMLLPGIGESYITATSRLSLSLLIALLVTPVIIPLTEVFAPSSPAMLLQMVGGEVVIGLFIGTLARTLLAAMAVCGTVVAFSTGFSNAFLFNPALNDQGVLQSVFFTLLGVLMILVTNTHHLFISAMVDSYELFAPGLVLSGANPGIVGDMADTMTHYTARAFDLGVRLSAPFLVVFVAMYILLAVLARVMPQLQVFFIVMPLQVLLGIFISMMVIGSIMIVFTRAMQDLAGTMLLF